jgi:MFS family permease
MRLRADPVVTTEDLERGKRALVKDAAWASLAGALYGGVILVGFALALDASPLIIGLLAAIPFLAQVAQLPAIVLIERIRQRRKIAVSAVTASRTVILSLALIPFLQDQPLQLAMLLAAQAAITLLGSVGGCAVNSWMHQLLAGQDLGALFSRRLFWSTVLASLGALLAGHLVEWWPLENKLYAYSVAFAAAGLAGYASSYYLARVPEPVMTRTGPPMAVLALLGLPLRDAHFRKVIVFMGAWNLASNLAAPFVTVYLLKQVGFQLGTVTTLWIASQLANALTMFLWGRLSDRLSNKAILAVALPAYFGCLVALPFAALPAVHALTLPLLYVIHMIMGAASGGIGLATGNLGLKLAPQGKGTVYLANVSLIGSLAGGIAAILGGALADWFASRQLSLLFEWTSPGASHEVTVLNFRHWEFLFAISFALGAYVMHALSRINEGPQISERAVIQQLVLEAGRFINQLSPIEGLKTVLLLPLGWLFDRRLRQRSAPLSPGAGRSPPK